MKATELDAALGAVLSETWLDSDCATAAASGDAVASQRRHGRDDSSPAPYYEDSAVTIYHGDCLELLPAVSNGVDLLLSDPPYGIAYKHSGKGSAVAGRSLMSTTRHSEAVRGDDKRFDPTPFLGFPDVILWGANHFCHSLPEDRGRWLIWDKADGRYGVDSFGDAELGWHNKGRAARLFRFAWKGVYCVKAGENNGRRQHPTMKPQGLMRWCLDLVPNASLVLDPFMGSGSTLRAAKDLGKRAIGIEIEERYCEVAAKRMSQEILNFASVASEPTPLAAQERGGRNTTAQESNEPNSPYSEPAIR